jgi:hypothetical protein
MGVSLYLIENPKVFLGNCCRPLIYFKSMPKSTKFIPPPISPLLTGPGPDRGGAGRIGRVTTGSARFTSATPKLNSRFD